MIQMMDDHDDDQYSEYPGHSYDPGPMYMVHDVVSHFAAAAAALVFVWVFVPAMSLSRVMVVVSYPLTHSFHSQ